MANVIVVILIIAVFCAAVISSVKHFKGEVGCCGGGSYKVKKKRLSHVQYTKKFIIGGMHCAHCKNRVEEIVNDISGISGSVCLKKNELMVSYSEDVSDETIISKIEKAGYTVNKTV